MMNPSWTETVSQAPSNDVNCQASIRLGVAAVPENQVEDANRTAVDTATRDRFAFPVLSWPELDIGVRPLLGLPDMASWSSPANHKKFH